MKQFLLFSLWGFSSIKGSCDFWKGRWWFFKALRMDVKHMAALGSQPSSHCATIHLGLFESLSNLFPYIIMTQRRLITLQTPFGCILMRDLNHSDKWEPSAWLVVEVGLLGGMRNLARHVSGLCFLLKVFVPEQTHEEFGNIKVGWWRGGVWGMVAFSKGQFR